METPEDSDWLRTFGSPSVTEEVSGDDFVRELRLEPESDQLLHVTWDVVGDSLRVRWTVGGVLRLDIFREGVWRISLGDQPAGTSGFRADYRHDDLSATTFVQVWPSFAYYDSPHHSWQAELG